MGVGLGMGNQPLESYIYIILLLARYRVAADLSVLDGRQVHLLDDLLLIQGVGEVSLVAEDQDRDACQLRLVEEVVQLVPRGLDLLQIGCVHHVHDGIHAAAIPLPHAAEPGLPPEIPHLDGDVAPCDFFQVEADRGDHVLAELAGGYHIEEGGFAGVLETDEGQFHLFLPEEALDPVQEPVDEREHFVVEGGGPFVEKALYATGKES